MAVSVFKSAAVLVTIYILYRICHTLYLSPLARIPGPRSFALTSWRLAYEDYNGIRTRTLHALHKEYGPAVRVGPNEVSFNSLPALRAIYGAGSGFERTDFYHMFEVYGRKNMFTVGPAKDHAERKKMIANAYAKSSLLKGNIAAMVEDKARLFLELIDRDGRQSEIFSTLHYFSLDTISQFLYGEVGKTSCLEGDERDRGLIEDIISIDRRRLSWFAVHAPNFTAWLYSLTGVAGSIARHFYPMQTPTTYTGIRSHALKACQAFAAAARNKSDVELRKEPAVIAKLWKHHTSQNKENGFGLDDADIASECADHLLAGIDTTSDTLMFLIWSLSRPGNEVFQEKVIREVRGISADQLNDQGIPRAEVCDGLVYLNAVIKETLRLFAPLSGSEPRSLAVATQIGDYVIPPRTVVSMSPYILHRNSDVFPDPMIFNPDRWVDSSPEKIGEMNRWFWAFSSGGRMCIGMQ
jgi:hypothetical protein